HRGVEGFDVGAVLLEAGGVQAVGDQRLAGDAQADVVVEVHEVVELAAGVRGADDLQHGFGPLAVVAAVERRRFDDRHVVRSVGRVVLIGRLAGLLPGLGESGHGSTSTSGMGSGMCAAIRARVSTTQRGMLSLHWPNSWLPTALTTTSG